MQVAFQPQEKSKTVLMAIHSGTMTLIIARRRRIPPRPVASADGHQRVTAGLVQTKSSAGVDRCFKPRSSGRGALGGGYYVIYHCPFKKEITFLSNSKKRFIFL